MLILAAVFLSFSGCDRVDCSYATLADARKDRVFKRGWLLDILPASTRQIRVISDVDTNHSEGEFWFDPADFSACGLTLMAKNTFIPNHTRYHQRWLILFSLEPMKITARLTVVAVIFSTILLSSGCQKKTTATDPASESTRGSTKPLEAADLVGYDGKRLRKSVDHIKKGNEEHNQEIETMAGSGPDQ